MEGRSAEPPVFVLGVPRSGTTLLYSMLLAAGGFAAYRKETYFYDLVPRFGGLKTEASRERFLRQWLNGYLGKVPGLDVEPLARHALDQSRHRREFLPRLMEAITRAQGAGRWMEATPSHLLYIDEIRKAVPEALMVHVIRDGRDCALSYERQGWIATLPWDRKRRLGIAALFWEWMVRNGRTRGRTNPSQYLEVRFEDLVGDPRGTLKRVGEFIHHDLDYDRIQRNPVHALKKPNTSFREERARGNFNPVGRWQAQCSAEDLRMCETLVGRYLQDLGYELAFPDTQVQVGQRLRASAGRALYLRYFASKHWLKANTPLGRFTRTTVWDEQPWAGGAAKGAGRQEPGAAARER